VLVFSFAVIELMYIYPAFSNFYEGLSYSGIRYGGEKVLTNKTRRIRISRSMAIRFVKKGFGQVCEEKTVADGKCRYYLCRTKERAQSVKTFTLFFMTLKLLLTVVPELTSLQLYDYIGSVSSDAINYSQFVPMLLVFVWTITLIFGIPWLVRTVLFLRSVKNDKQYVDRMKEKYFSEIYPDAGRRISGNMASVLTLIGLGVIFTFDLYIDRVNCTPNFIAAAFMLSAGAVMLKYSKLSLGVICSSVLWGVISFFNMMRQIEYFDKYTLHSVNYVPAAAEAYAALEISSAVEYAVGIIVYIFVFASLIRTAKAHISMIGTQTSHLQYSSEDRHAEIRFCVNSRSVAIAVIAVICMIGSALYPFLVASVEFYLPIVMVAQIILIVYALYSLLVINDEVYKRLRGDY